LPGVEQGGRLRKGHILMIQNRLFCLLRALTPTKEGRGWKDGFITIHNKGEEAGGASSKG